MRRFEYAGEPMLTRGDYGVRVEGGHTTDEEPDVIFVFDPDFGDMAVCSVEVGLQSGDWIEIVE